MKTPLNERRKLVITLAGFTLAALPCVAAAQTTAPPGGPATAPLEGTRMAGEGLLRFFGLKVYRARLWVSPGFAPERFSALALALELEYLRSLSGNAIAKRSLEEMRRAGPIPDEKAAAWLQALTATIPNVADGDRLTGIYRPNDALELLFTQGQSRRSLGKIGDAEFAARFMGIWLAPVTSEPELRRALLGSTATAQ